MTRYVQKAKPVGVQPKLQTKSNYLAIYINKTKTIYTNKTKQKNKTKRSASYTKSRLTVVSREAKKKQAVRDERVCYLQVAPLWISKRCK